ncbi:hypothetical protein SAMN02745181_0423 [Rubritalea squalenifaciens DSM 18772]|uniref:Uncharacterized protein n=1 Tax=Rubritalea squalenifaciens DSM 18772 TaxID=1123071 RepID=A0A1M6C948_9BACT|nr:hypothetical protein [Rubritalea squalenifaciens]SHI57570.1 hypothetical protein SAMN02745181_0423 [Rubritalea squalenifaciens DSM 18772]
MHRVTHILFRIHLGLSVLWFTLLFRLEDPPLQELVGESLFSTITITLSTPLLIFTALHDWGLSHPTNPLREALTFTICTPLNSLVAAWLLSLVYRHFIKPDPLPETPDTTLIPTSPNPVHPNKLKAPAAEQDHFPPRPQPSPAPFTTEHVYMLALLGKAGAEKAMIQWAVARLEEGCEGESTILLAGADHEDEDTIGYLFHKALQESSFTPPLDDEEAAWLEQQICREMLAGHLTPQLGLDYLLRACTQCGYSDILHKWEKLYDAIDMLRSEGQNYDSHAGMTLATIDDHILQQARQVLDESQQP